MNKSSKFTTLILVGVILTLPGCNHDDDNESDNGTAATPKTYNITVSNLTHNQPLSPIASVLHNSGYHAYSLGDSANNALETLAESGDNSVLLSTANMDDRVLNTASGSGIIAPGASETLSLTSLIDEPQLTLMTMQSIPTMLLLRLMPSTSANSFQVRP